MATTKFKFTLLSRQSPPVKGTNFGDGNTNGTDRLVPKKVYARNNKPYYSQKKAVTTVKLLDEKGVITNDKSQTSGKTVEIKEVKDIFTATSSTYVNEMVDEATFKWEMDLQGKSILIQNNVTLSEIKQINAGAYYAALNTLSAWDGVTTNSPASYQLITTDITILSATPSYADVVQILSDVDFLDEQWDYENQIKVFQEKIALIGDDPSNFCAIYVALHNSLHSSMPYGIPKISCSVSDNGFYYDTATTTKQSLYRVEA